MSGPITRLLYINQFNCHSNSMSKYQYLHFTVKKLRRCESKQLAQQYRVRIATCLFKWTGQDPISGVWLATPLPRFPGVEWRSAGAGEAASFQNRCWVRCHLSLSLPDFYPPLERKEGCAERPQGHFPAPVRGFVTQSFLGGLQTNCQCSGRREGRPLQRGVPHTCCVLADSKIRIQQRVRSLDIVYQVHYALNNSEKLVTAFFSSSPS